MERKDSMSDVVLLAPLSLQNPFLVLWPVTSDKIKWHEMYTMYGPL